MVLRSAPDSTDAIPRSVSPAQIHAVGCSARRTCHRPLCEWSMPMRGRHSFSFLAALCLAIALGAVPTGAGARARSVGTPGAFSKGIHVVAPDDIWVVGAQ